MVEGNCWSSLSPVHIHSLDALEQGTLVCVHYCLVCVSVCVMTHQAWVKGGAKMYDDSIK